MLATVLGVMVLQTLTYANEERLRVPVAPFLILMAAGGADYLLYKYVRSRQQSVIAESPLN